MLDSRVLLWSMGLTCWRRSEAGRVRDASVGRQRGACFPEVHTAAGAAGRTYYLVSDYCNLCRTRRGPF